MMNITNSSEASCAGNDIHSVSMFPSNIQSLAWLQKRELQNEKQIADLKTMVEDLVDKNTTLQNQISISQSQIELLQAQVKTAANQQAALHRSYGFLQRTFDNPALTSFGYFPKLPVELRVKIWRLYPSPRIFKICDDYYGCFCEYGLRWHKLPTIFAINQESRGEAKKIYIKWNCTTLEGVDCKFRHKCWHIYFNSQLDTLMLPSTEIDDWDILELCAKLSVRHLAAHKCTLVELLSNNNRILYQIWSDLSSFTIVNNEVVNETYEEVQIRFTDNEGAYDGADYMTATLKRRYFTWWCKRQDGDSESDQESEEEDGEDFNDSILEKVFCPQWGDTVRFLESEMATIRKERDEEELGPGAELRAKECIIKKGLCYRHP